MEGTVHGLQELLHVRDLLLVEREALLQAGRIWWPLTLRRV